MQCFWFKLESWSWKFSLRSIVTPRSFCECVFSMSKLLTDILVFISKLERKWYLDGFLFIALWKNHSNIFLDAHSSFSKTLFGRFPYEYCEERNVERQRYELVKTNHTKVYWIIQDVELILVGRRILYVPRDCKVSAITYEAVCMKFSND